MLSLINRGQYSTSVENEFQHLVSQLRGLFSNLLDTDGNLLPGDTPSGLTPIGSIVPFAGSEAPPGWVLADGRAVSRVRYAALFRVIGTTYGVGDGSTSFNVPDLRGRFILGVAQAGTGATLGGTGGVIDHTHTISGGTGDAGAHDHTGATGGAGTHSHSVSVSGTTDTTGSSNNTAAGADFGSAPPAHVHTFSGSGSTSSDGSHAHSIATTGDHSHSVSGSSSTNNPPFMALNTIIFAGA